MKPIVYSIYITALLLPALSILSPIYIISVYGFLTFTKQKIHIVPKSHLARMCKVAITFLFASLLISGVFLGSQTYLESLNAVGKDAAFSALLGATGALIVYWYYCVAIGLFRLLKSSVYPKKTGHVFTAKGFMNMRAAFSIRKIRKVN